MFCSKCGKKIQDDAKFCPFCGNTINVQTDTEDRHDKRGGKEEKTGTSSPKHFSKILLALSVIILGVVMGAGGYYFFEYRMDKNGGDQINVNEVIEGSGISRYEWIKMLCENYSLKAYKESSPYFQDVDNTSEYFPYVQAAVESGILASKGTFNGEAAVTGKYAAVTTCKAIGQSAFVIYTGDETEWTNDKYVQIAVELGMIDSGKVNSTLNEEECSNLIQTAIYIDNNELWLDDYVDVEYKKGTYEIDDSMITALSDDGNEISLSEGNYKVGDSLVFHNQQGLVVVRTVVAVKDDNYVLEDAQLDNVLEKYYVSDIKEITLDDIYSSGGWTVGNKGATESFFLPDDDIQMMETFFLPESYETDINGDDNAFTITLSGTDNGELEIALEDNKNPVIKKTLGGFDVEPDLEMSIAMKNLKLKYRYDYWGAESKVTVDCDSTVKGEASIEKDLVNIPLWEPIPEISLGRDTVSASLGLYFTVNAKGEISFTFDMPISAGVQRTVTIITPVMQLRGIANPTLYMEGEVFVGLEFKIDVTILGEEGCGVDAYLRAGIKAEGSRTIRVPDEENNIIGCFEVKVTAPYYKIHGGFKGFDPYEFEEGIELPHKLHVELYSSGKPRVKVVDQCTYKEPKKKSEDTSLLKRDKTEEKEKNLQKKDAMIIDEEEIKKIALALGECLSEGRYSDLKYDPKDNNFLQTAVYYFSALFSDQLGDSIKESTNGMEFFVKREKVEEYVSVLFEGKEELPLQGEDIITYDSNLDAYQFWVGDAGEYYVEIDSTEWNKEELVAEVSLFAGEEGYDANLDLKMKITLVYNPNSNAYKRGMIYSVRDCKVTYMRESWL